MAPDLLALITSLALIILSVVLISTYVQLNRSMTALADLMKRLQSDVSPIMGDLATISGNMAAASEDLRSGMQQFSRMSDAVGNIGGDIEEGRRAVKGTMEMVGALAGLVAPWLSKLKMFRKE